MEWVVVVLFILLGLGLLVAEIVLIPGTTVVGIIGCCLALAGVLMSFRFFGQSTGWIILSATSVAMGGMLYWSLRTNVWRKFALKNTIDSKVNEGVLSRVTAGQEGVAVSALRPMGKADVGGKLYEVTTLGNFLESGTRIKIIKISNNQIFVEPIN